MVLLLLYRSQEVKEALRAQMEVQRRLHEQVEVNMSSHSAVLSTSIATLAYAIMR